MFPAGRTGRGRVCLHTCTGSPGTVQTAAGWNCQGTERNEADGTATASTVLRGCTPGNARRRGRRGLEPPDQNPAAQEPAWPICCFPRKIKTRQPDHQCRQDKHAQDRAGYHQNLGYRLQILQRAILQPKNVQYDSEIQKPSKNHLLPLKNSRKSTERTSLTLIILP